MELSHIKFDRILSPRLTDGVTMYIDYIRIYQEQGKESVTCDPRKFSHFYLH